MVRNVFKIMTGALFIMDYDSLKLESHFGTMRKRVIENSTINHPAISKCVDTFLAENLRVYTVMRFRVWSSSMETQPTNFGIRYLNVCILQYACIVVVKID
jgi:hypothetical protein